MKELTDKILESTTIDLLGNVVQEILEDLEPMVRSNEDILQSYHIKEEMTAILNQRIKDYKLVSFDTLIKDFLNLDNDAIDSKNKYNKSKDMKDYDNTTLINATLIVMINEIKSRVN